HSQRRVLRVFLAVPAGIGGKPLRQQRAPGVILRASRGSHNLVLPEFRKPIRRKRSVSRKPRDKPDEELPSISAEMQRQIEADRTDIKKQLKHAQQQLDLTNAYPDRRGGTRST